MRNSDIFNDYAKIAEEKGLISLSEEEVKTQPDKPKESAKMKRYKKSPYPRMGSDTIEVIQALYGVKPDNSIDYENNIMEAAHKTPVVIAPAYDRLNALVENNIERNNIMCDIALKQNDSITSMHRYAEKELLMQLVRVANDMDNAGNEDIRVLADACIEKLALKKNAKEWYDDLVEKGKEWLGVGTGAGENALIGSAIGGILGGLFGGLPGAWAGMKAGGFLGGGATALIASLAKTAPHVVSISANAKDAMDQMNDLINKLPADNKERTFLTTFNQILKSTAYFSEQYNELITSLQTNPSNVEDADRSKKIAASLVEANNTVKEYAQKFNQDVKLGIFNEADSHSKVLDPLYNMMNTDVEDIQQSLVSLLSAIDKFEKTLHGDVKSTANEVAQSQQGTQVKPVSNQNTPSDNVDWSNIAKELGHEPSEEEKRFLASLT
jgi:hypothetical protein